METLFILKTISMKRKTDQIRQKEYQLYNLKYNRHISYDKYISLQKSWNSYDFSYFSEDNAYFLDYELTKKHVKDNIWDLNDGGVYNYIAIIGIPVNHLYAIVDIQSIHIFKYDENKNEYKEIPLNYNEETKCICKKLNMEK